MARIRTIKPEFPQSESMGNITRDARLCFIMLWTLADDVGRLRGNSRMLASLLFPYDDDAPGLISGWLEELVREKCIVVYESDGSTYVQILKWAEHQKIDKPSGSKFPDFVESSDSPRESSRILSNPRERSCLDQGSRTKDQDQGEEIEKQTLTSLQKESSPPEKPALVVVEADWYEIDGDLPDVCRTVLCEIARVPRFKKTLLDEPSRSRKVIESLWAKASVAGMPAEVFAEHAQAFVSYFSRNKNHVDGVIAFRNWVNKELERVASNARSAPRGPAGVDVYAQVYREYGSSGQ